MRGRSGEVTMETSRRTWGLNLTRKQTQIEEIANDYVIDVFG